MVGGVHLLPNHSSIHLHDVVTFFPGLSTILSPMPSPSDEQAVHTRSQTILISICLTSRPQHCYSLVSATSSSMPVAATVLPILVSVALLLSLISITFLASLVYAAFVSNLDVCPTVAFMPLLSALTLRYLQCSPSPYLDSFPTLNP